MELGSSCLAGSALAHGRDRPVRPLQASVAALQTDELDQLAADRRALPGTSRGHRLASRRLNGAVAVAEADEPAAALAIVDALDLDGPVLAFHPR